MNTNQLLKVLDCDANHLNWLKRHYPKHFVYVHEGGLGKGDQAVYSDKELKPLIAREKALQEFKKGVW